MGCYRLDDRTWNDLDMALVFASLDRTLSPAGAQRLYQLLSELLASAKAITSLRVKGLADVQAELAQNLAGTRPISNRSFALALNDPLDIMGFMRAARLKNSIRFFQLRALMIEHREKLRILYKTIGLLDVAQSIASFASRFRTTVYRRLSVTVAR
jgi:hypothetical protein